MWLLFLICWMPDGDLVLRNGKRVGFVGDYEVAAPYVRFTGKDGQFLQVPLKLVDLEKTEALATQRAAEAAAARVPKQPTEDEVPEERAPGLADLVDNEVVGREVSIDDEDVDGYVDQSVKNERNRQWYRGQYEDRVTYQEPPDGQSIQEMRRVFTQLHRALEQAERETEARIKELEETVKDLDEGVPLVDEDDEYPAETKQRARIRAAEQELAQQRNKLARIKEGKRKLAKEAARRGVNGFRN